MKYFSLKLSNTTTVVRVMAIGAVLLLLTVASESVFTRGGTPSKIAAAGAREPVAFRSEARRVRNQARGDSANEAPEAPSEAGPTRERVEGTVQSPDANQNQNQNQNQRPEPAVGKPVRPIDMNKDLRTLPQIPATPPFERPEFRRHPPPRESEGTKPVFPTGQKPFDTALQLLLPQPNMPGLDLSFDGIDRAASGCACSPPDTNGDVGPNHYIQNVNVGFEIWNKSGSVLQAATTFNTLWGTGGTNPCTQGLHQGDPIVFYDHLVDRWVVSDFAFGVSGPNTVAPYYECVAVSKTPDPVAGGWWLYAIQQDTVNTDWLGDYPKFGVWSDGWYGSYNMFCGAASCTFGARNSFQGVQVFALDRTTMITGAAITPILFRLTPAQLGDSYTLLPGTFRFGAPPAGREEFFASIDSPASSATILDKVHIRKFHVDFGTPANSTLSAPADVTVSNFQDAFSLAGSTNIVPQSGTAVLLDTVGDRLFMNLFYQNLGGTESLWATHTINNVAPTAIRWYQFDVSGGTVAGAPVQQGTFDGAADGLSRWMPSLAVDQLGNMAIGYSASNASSFPSIRYNGRLTTDTAGVLGQGESIMTAGSGSQTSSGGRWGDYSQMTVDPTNGCNLWFTNEYLTATGSNWKTRVGLFAFSACTGTGILTGTVTDAATTNPISGATVTAGANVTTTNGSGVYTFNPINSGTYTVTASQPGYTAGVANNVVVNTGLTTIQNFALSACTFTTKTWIGAGAGGAGTDFNTAGNWSPSGVPTACNDVVMTLTNGAIVTLSGDVAIHNLSTSISGANNVFRLDVGAHSLTVNGTTTGSAPSGNGSTQMQFNVGNSPGQFVFIGDATFSSGGSPVTFPLLGIGNTTGQVIFRGNATFNAGSGTSSGNTPAKVVFDAPATQTITDNAGTALILLGNSSTEIGSTNTPSVIVAGSASNFQPQGNLNIKAGATLDLATRTFNRSAAGGTLTLNSGSTLKLAANTGGQTGSNFPSNFTTFSLNSASTVEYNAAGGTNQTIFNSSTYGHLTLSRGSGAGTTTKTAGGALTVVGDLTINANAIFAGGTSLGHNIGGNWVNNGTFSFTTASTINFNTAGVKTISGSSTTAFNNVTINKGSDTSSSLEAVAPMSMTGNLLLSNGLLKLTNASAVAQFNAAPTIASTAGVWINGGTLNGGNFSSTNNGLVKITGGAATFGTASGNALTNNATGTVDIQGGAISFSGRLVNTGGAVSISGGTTRITTVGNASSSAAGFDMNAASTVNMTAGTVEFQNANSSGTTPNDLRILSGGTKSITGGTFQMGNGSTPGGQNFKINSGVPLFNLTMSSAATLNAAATVNGALTLNNDLTATGFVLTENGSSGGTGDVIGDVMRTDLAGTAKAFGNPDVQVAINSGTITALTVNLDKGHTPTDFPQAVLRSYLLTPGAGSLTQGTVRLHYLDAELNTNSEGSTLHLWRQNGLTWSDQGQSSFDSTANWVEQNNVTSFSPWVISGPSAPTAVKLAKFMAYRLDQGVALTWESGYEVNNLGYHVYREQNGKRTRVTPSPVAGSALKVGPQARLTAGFAYSWFDRKGGADSAYYLESIDLNGQRMMSGPVYPLEEIGDVRAMGKTRALLLNEIAAADQATSPSALNVTEPTGREWPAAMKEAGESAKAQPAADSLAVQQSIAAGAAAKISVRHNGWYRLTQAQLVAACLDVNADARNLQLYVDGQEIPMRVNTEGTRLGPSDTIEFYGVALDTPTTDTHIYWLINGSSPGKRITGKSTVGKGRDRLFDDSERLAGGFDLTIERSDKLVYFAGLLNGDGNNIFGPPVTSEPLTQTLAVRNRDTGTPSALVAVDLQGLTTGGHSVQVKFNGADLGTIGFNGLEHPSQTFTVPGSSVHDGDNTITLTATGGESDVSLLDSVRLTYGHAYRADANLLRFSVAGGQAVMVNGFSSPDIRVLDITNPGSVNELSPPIGSSGSGYAFKLQAPGRDQRVYLAFTDQLAEQPAAIAANEPSSWNSSANGADMVIITPREFRASVEPLAQLRRGQGLNVAIVDVEDVFDEFSYGAHTPDALKSFLAWTAGHWQVAPHYLLLAGDSSWDPRNYLDQDYGDFVPTKLIDTAYMETASDDWLADFTGDGVAEIAVGRLPGRTAADISLMVSKIISFDHELQVGGPSRGALFVADNDFGARSAATEALLPPTMSVQNINRDDVDNDTTMHSQIVNAIDDGPLLVNYYGHGSVTVWTGAGLLDSDSAASLTNGSRLSVFTMMTCLNGYSHDAYIDSLGESLLKAPQGGAVAVWASAGFTEPEPQFLMDQQLYAALFTGPSPRLGDAIRAARLTVLDNDVRRTWILLGDPTMRLR